MAKVAHDPEAELEPEVSVESQNKALPAPKLLHELLGDIYVFHDNNQQTTWNENELEQVTKEKSHFRCRKPNLVLCSRH
jgi:hypothetical protein